MDRGAWLVGVHAVAKEFYNLATKEKQIYMLFKSYWIARLKAVN